MEQIKTKADYIHSLEKQLRRLPAEDREKALEYFEEYFSEAGPDREALAIEDLGQPQSAAEQIIKNLAIKNSAEPVRSVKKGINGVWIGLLALFALPIGLPVAAGLFLVLLCLCIALFLFYFVIFLWGSFLVGGGLFSIVAAFTAITADFGRAVGAFGLGLIGVGCGVIVLVGICNLTRITMKGLIRFCGKIVRKRSPEQKRRNPYE